MARLLTPSLRALALAAALGGVMDAHAAAAADPGHGKAVFAAQCAMCHSAGRGGPAILGPNLFGVIGRRAGSVTGFSYSPAMKAAGFAWSDERLRAYLPAPRAYLPGVKMTYAGLKNPAQLDDLVAYLEALK